MSGEDERYAQRLRERFSAPALVVDPGVIVRRGRRRRLGAWTAAGTSLVAVGVGAVLLLGGVPRPVSPGPAEPPPEPADAEAALVVTPAVVSPGATVSVTIVNRGSVPLVGGAGVEAQRWDGSAWRAAGVAGLCFGDGVPDCRSGIVPGRDIAVPSIGIPAPAGGSSSALGLSTQGLADGWYRLTMTLSDTSATGAPRTLSAVGQFEVAPVPTTAPTSSGTGTPRPPAPTSTAPAGLALDHATPTTSTLYVAATPGGLDPGARVEWWDGSAWRRGWDVRLAVSERVATHPGELRTALPNLPAGDYRLVATGPTGELSGTFSLADPGIVFVGYPDQAVPAPVRALGDVIAVSRASSSAPAAFSARTPLPTCGAYVVGQGAPQMIPWGCLDAGTVTSAELVVVRPTTEGDPIVTYYRTAPGTAGVEEWVDATRDAFGPRTWEHLTCRTSADGGEPTCG